MYGARASPATVASAMSRPPLSTAAAAHARSPPEPGPACPRGKQTMQPPISGWPEPRRHGGGEAVDSSCWIAISAAGEAGHTMAMIAGMGLAALGVRGALRARPDVFYRRVGCRLAPQPAAFRRERRAGALWRDRDWKCRGG